MNIHDHADINHRPRSLLLLAVFITGLTFALEAAGGLWTQSLALVSDAAHVLMDLTALLVSVWALRLAERPVTHQKTFGYHRLEVFSAFLNGFLVLGVAMWIGVEAFRRFHAPPEIKVGPMLVIAVAGLAANLFVAWRLHGFAKDDINIRGAFLHVVGDTLASVAVIVSGILVAVTGIRTIDLFAGLLVALLIVVNAFRLLRESLHILMEGVPPGMDVEAVTSSLRNVPGVLEVEDVHLWSLCSHMPVLSAHLTLKPEEKGNQQRILAHVNTLLRDQFQITHSTIEMR
jgi:cobalt-zinc-cadmium efflux system protein